MNLSQSLGQTASGQNADLLETGPEQISPDNIKQAKASSGHLQHHSAALKAWENGSNTAKDGKADQPGQQPLLVMSAPSGIASVTPQSQTVAAGTNLDLVAQRDTNQTTGRRWIHNVGQHLSLFVQGVKDKTSLKLFTAKGKIQLQAQSDSMELTADQDIHITSAKSQQLFNGKKEVLLTCAGAYIRIKDGKIELHAPGSVSFKGGQHDWSGPSSLIIPAEMTLSSQPYDEQFHLVDSNGASHVNTYYTAKYPSGELAYGITDGEGKTSRISTSGVHEIHIFLGHIGK